MTYRITNEEMLRLHKYALDCLGEVTKYNTYKTYTLSSSSELLSYMTTSVDDATALVLSSNLKILALRQQNILHIEQRARYMWFITTTNMPVPNFSFDPKHFNSKRMEKNWADT